MKTSEMFFGVAIFLLVAFLTFGLGLQAGQDLERGKAAEAGAAEYFIDGVYTREFRYITRSCDHDD